MNVNIFARQHLPRNIHGRPSNSTLQQQPHAIKQEGSQASWAISPQQKMRWNHLQTRYTKGLKCYVDADLAGGWQQEDSSNAENIMSRTGMVIMYENFSIYWCSSLQTEITLSTAKAEYIALSYALRELLPLMTMME